MLYFEAVLYDRPLSQIDQHVTMSHFLYVCHVLAFDKLINIILNPFAYSHHYDGPLAEVFHMNQLSEKLLFEEKELLHFLIDFLRQTVLQIERLNIFFIQFLLGVILNIADADVFAPLKSHVFLTLNDHFILI